MVFVDDATMANLKNSIRQDELAMTPWERERAGQMFRIQLPIIDRASMKEHAALLRRLATIMETASTMHHQRDFHVVNIIKGEVAAVNNRARHTKCRAADQSRGSNATQNLDDQSV